MSGKEIEYVAEKLTGLTEASAVKQAEVELWDFVSKRWNWSEEKEIYQANTRKDRRERAIFNTLYQEVKVIMAADKDGVFETPAELFELARNNETRFKEIYSQAIKLNPTLKPTSLEEAQTDPN